MSGNGIWDRLGVLDLEKLVCKKIENQFDKEINYN